MAAFKEDAEAVAVAVAVDVSSKSTKEASESDVSEQDSVDEDLESDRTSIFNFFRSENEPTSRRDGAEGVIVTITVSGNRNREL